MEAKLVSYHLIIIMNQLRSTGSIVILEDLKTKTLRHAFDIFVLQ